ncbi:hypothetical protein BACCIP111895_02478 [Neobacillus rhizosphaerae]|uniref:Uncharacterized protein n=1 Tax=Neobacillus rhizosphaerae TaxID=2880965 RepID=A0ABM9ERP7_9BACI|nr:hypothetical protein BACCIP111895_02478 [Neobacillus rhizosphaerae]
MRKAEAPSQRDTRIGRGSERLLFNLLAGLAYDLDPPGAGARQLSKFSDIISDFRKN